MNETDNDTRPAAPPPERVPTLTEVVDVDFPLPRQAPAAAAVGGPDARATTVAEATEVPVIDEAALVARVLGAVLRQVDVALEYRLREAMVPAFSRLAEALVAEARCELASSLRDIIARSVAQELARHNDRSNSPFGPTRFSIDTRSE